MTDIKNVKMYTTISEAYKKENGGDGFYDGQWLVTAIDYRNEEVELSNGRVSISKRFCEINEIVCCQLTHD